MIIEVDEENDLVHYGILRKSGRYPWGSGETQYARNQGFLDHLDQMKKAGLSEKDIAKGLSGKDKSEEVSIAQLRDARMIALNQNKLENYYTAAKLSEKGVSNGEIAKRLNLAGESSVRALLAPGVKDKLEKKLATAKMLEDEVKRKEVIDIGKGVEANLNISAEQLRAAAGQLQEQGYNVHKFKKAVGATGHKTEYKVLTLPNITQKEVWMDTSRVKQIDMVMSNADKKFKESKKHEYVSIDPKRVDVKFGDEGGSAADGVIYVRKGVPDVSLGNNRYAQVRIKVGDGHYLKGMALYSDDLPKGADLQFNTAKSRADSRAKAQKEGWGDEKLGALKPLETANKDYPFGSVVKPQILDRHKDTERVVSALNLVNKEGDWEKWSRNVSAQALSKQAPSLAKEQLALTLKARQKEYDDIMKLTNPVVKAKLLKTFSDATDKSAVHLKAAALERQNWHVILPIPSLKPNEVYAPKYKDGESVVLIRYPHGGTFEIPEVRVNNKHRGARSMLGLEPKDAIGIHPSIAERLSGADFDGDTVLVIPNDRKQVKTHPALEGLKGFDAKVQYRLPEGQKSRIHTQTEMGKISNLITDMTLMGAPHDQIARAVKHSMVVIDADKHNLDHRRSAQDFSINELKRRYQGVNASGQPGGAATIISRAKSELRVPERKARLHKDGGPIDKETGELRWVPTGAQRRETKMVVDPDTGKKVRVETGRLVDKTTKTTKLAERKDAHGLVSDAGTRVEKIYADHSNNLKSLANQARLSMIRQPKMQTNPTAKKVFAAEVASLNSKIALARMNAPRERQAQLIAAQIVRAKRAANPDLDANSIKKITFAAQEEARLRMGVETKPIKITKEEWSAIQAGAVTEKQLKDVLDKADLEVVKQLATPKGSRVLAPSDVALARRLLNSGEYTVAQVAQRLGVSPNTINAYTIGDADDDEDE